MIRSSQKVEVTAGQTVNFTIGFKNIGKVAWKNSGDNFISLYTAGPSYRKSSFSDAAWLSETQPALLQDAEVKPGAVGRFSFPLFAPLEPGTYHEKFVVAAEDVTFVNGGNFNIDITVRKPTGDLSAQPAPGFKALKLLVSEREVTLDGGESHQFRVGFKNIGKVPWSAAGSAPLTIRDISTDIKYKFQNASWKRDVTAELSGSEVKPGGVAFFTFDITAPREGGKYNPKFSLMAGDSAVDGGDLQIPVEVIDNEPPPQQIDVPSNEFAGSGNRGPEIRVGICYIPRVWDDANRKVLQSCDHDLSAPVVLAAAGTYLFSVGNNQPVRALSGVTTVNFDFTQRLFVVQNGDFSYSSPDLVSFKPDDPSSTIFEIQNFQDRPAWDQTINYNRYRGTMEFRYTPATDRLWIIERLPIEDYIRGLAETSDTSPTEYQRALVTAARTYALYVISVGGKHQSEFHDLNRTGNDQVYRGYASELVRPNVARAAEDTRGIGITYNNEIVVTPYFSRSDGRTRSWSEVWYGSRPWLISKPAPYDTGRTLLGHGVGMSAADAVGRANAGGAWRDILSYYYSGIALSQLY